MDYDEDLDLCTRCFESKYNSYLLQQWQWVWFWVEFLAAQKFQSTMALLCQERIMRKRGRGEERDTTTHLIKN